MRDELIRLLGGLLSRTYNSEIESAGLDSGEIVANVLTIVEDEVDDFTDLIEETVEQEIARGS